MASGPLLQIELQTISWDILSALPCPLWLSRESFPPAPEALDHNASVTGGVRTGLDQQLSGNHQAGLSLPFSDLAQRLRVVHWGSSKGEDCGVLTEPYTKSQCRIPDTQQPLTVSAPKPSIQPIHTTSKTLCLSLCLHFTDAQNFSSI